ILGVENSALLAPALGKARRELKRLADDYSLDVDPDAIVQDVSVGQQQRVEILKALYRGADTLILDEPTGVLTPAEADDLFRVLNGNVLSLEGDDGAARARAAGLAHVPEDRQSEGLVVQFEEWENNILGYQHDAVYGKGPILDIAAARKQAAERMKKFDVRPA